MHGSQIVLGLHRVVGNDSEREAIVDVVESDFPGRHVQHSHCDPHTHFLHDRHVFNAGLQRVVYLRTSARRTRPLLAPQADSVELNSISLHDTVAVHGHVIAELERARNNGGVCGGNERDRLALVHMSGYCRHFLNVQNGAVARLHDGL